jgi:cation transport regulator ChaC
MKSEVTIFGYGSLVSIKSLRETVPIVDQVRPATLKGYRRVFDTASSTRYTSRGVPISVLNIVSCDDVQLNGVVFEVSEEYFLNLAKREGAYKSVSVAVQLDDAQERQAFVFVGLNERKQEFLFDDPTQISYLQICLSGARELGNHFYKTFLDTTYIDDLKLDRVSKLTHLL